MTINLVYDIQKGKEEITMTTSTKPKVKTTKKPSPKTASKKTAAKKTTAKKPAKKR